MTFHNSKKQLQCHLRVINNTEVQRDQLEIDMLHYLHFFNEKLKRLRDNKNILAQ